MIDRVHLTKVLIDGGVALNIIFTNTLQNMGFNIGKLSPCQDPFCGIIPGKASYPFGWVTLPVNFGKPKNYNMEYLTFEVTDFDSSYHVILSRPMLAKFMAIPNLTYMNMKMSPPNSILSIFG